MTDGHGFIVVFGASAGGMRALTPILSALPAHLPASVVIVIHTPKSDDSNLFIARLRKTTAMPCHIAGDEMPLRVGHVYFAPADFHTLIKKDRILVGKGPPEGRWRPSIDSTLRSAAVAYNSRCIGVILTGMLDDGTAGMDAVKRCGGITAVQDPAEADYPSMPQSVLDHLKPDACLPVAAIPAAIAAFLQRDPPPSPVPDDLRLETGITEKASTGLEQMEALGKNSSFSCPQCGGCLWEMNKGNLVRYRCHIGHSFTQQDLLEDQKRLAEQTLWMAFRIMEEKYTLLKNIAAKEEKQSWKALSKEHYSRAEELNIYLKRLKDIIVGVQTTMPD